MHDHRETLDPLASDRIDLVNELAHMEPRDRATAFRALPKEDALAVFVNLETAHQEELLEHLLADQVHQLVGQMDPDDRVRLLDELPEIQAEELVARLTPGERAMTDLLLGYPEETAGRIMSPEFVHLRPDATVAEALTAVREQGDRVEQVYVLPVTDGEGQLLGMVELQDLVLASPETRVSDLMDMPVRAVQAEADQEMVARLIQSADVLAMPVVDPEGHLVGLVTVDDAMDVLDFEEGEDFARTGGAEPLGRPYFSASLIDVARARVVWLLVLAAAATLTVNVLSAFEATLEAVVSLALFIPLLIGTGGNAGAQSATTLVRAMALDEVRFRDMGRVVFREAGTGLMLGVMLAVLAYVPVWLFQGPAIAAVVSLSLATVCAWGALVGSGVPMVAKRVGVDPAIVSAPFVTTLVDATGLLVYFLIAHAILPL